MEKYFHNKEKIFPQQVIKSINYKMLFINFDYIKVNNPPLIVTIKRIKDKEGQFGNIELPMAQIQT